ncbi:metal ABC transporter ATP-binding protein [Rhodococcus gannanensis]|uniref:Metal ABC transporter ATP-binding protein n=1 Tax=Rhodococcus gannanensis TaxID=1960308 RepID=A0ABW4P9K3_9NOCA
MNGQPVISMRGVTYRYGSCVALDDVSLTIESGTLVALVGGNGSGKSTLLGILADLLEPALGSVECRTRRRPAIVFQRPKSSDELPLTVCECVSIGRYGPRRLFRRLGGADRRIVTDLMERLEIDHLAGRQFRDLSGGQQQRTLLAQGLAQQSDLLLLDEPTSALDVAGQAIVDEVLREATAAGTTVVHATHRLEDAVRSDQSVELAAGRVVHVSTRTDAARTATRPLQK